MQLTEFPMDLGDWSTAPTVALAARTILDEDLGFRPDFIEHRWRMRCAIQLGARTTGRLTLRNANR